jgi:aryl-alcohol dehydrogenase-like predicted oxidoreductase
VGLRNFGDSAGIASICTERAARRTAEATGKWLRDHNLRSEFFLCTQICHQGWDAARQIAVNRLTPEAMEEDVAADLRLLGTDYLDFVYFGNTPSEPVESIIEAVTKQIRRGRVRAFGVRNWSVEQIKMANSYAVPVGVQGISAIVTTELSFLKATCPLWPEDVPFTQLEPMVCELGLGVFAHADDFNQGRHLFDDGGPQPESRWTQRWNHPDNRVLVQRVREFAVPRGLAPSAVNLAWLLNRPFPVIALVSLPCLLSETGFEKAPHLTLSSL